MKAVMEAAIDMRRLGDGDRIAESLLRDAAPGYIDDETWHQLPDGWPVAALARLTDNWRGLPGPLIPVKPRPSEPVSQWREYRLADFIEQTGAHTRLRGTPPEEFGAPGAKHSPGTGP